MKLPDVDQLLNRALNKSNRITRNKVNIAANIPSLSPYSKFQIAKLISKFEPQPKHENNHSKKLVYAYSSKLNNKIS